jgi:hypothetical protein
LLGAGGDRDFAVLLSGQSAALARDTSATELVEQLAEETTRGCAPSLKEPMVVPIASLTHGRASAHL